MKGITFKQTPNFYFQQSLKFFEIDPWIQDL